MTSALFQRLRGLTAKKEKKELPAVTVVVFSVAITLLLLLTNYSHAWSQLLLPRQ